RFGVSGTGLRRQEEQEIRHSSRPRLAKKKHKKKGI
ncbi:MAG: hypothetical protein ACI9L9_002748, partial [Marivirga sp.]